MPTYLVDPNTGLLVLGSIGNGSATDPFPYGSGILAISLPQKYQIPGTGQGPGDITVTALNGNIVSTLGGIGQFFLGGSLTVSGATITLAAHGTPPTAGNVNLGAGGVIGENVDISADGNVQGLIVSRENSNITAAENVNATVLSGGTANVSASGSIGGTIIGGLGVTAQGADVSGANIMSQNADVNGGQSSTLGTAATATSAAQAASQQSNADNDKQLSQNTDSSDQDDQKKRSKGPALARRGRVTVILPRAM